jgi:hypothetical protein
MAAHLSSPHASSLVLSFPRPTVNGLRWEGSAFGECPRRRQQDLRTGSTWPHVSVHFAHTGFYRSYVPVSAAALAGPTRQTALIIGLPTIITFSTLATL